MKKDRILTKIAGEWFRQSDLYKLAPDKLAELCEALDSRQLEAITDACFRDGGAPEPELLRDYVKHLTYVLRPFACATRDESLNECEKTFSIFYRNAVFMRRFIKEKNLKEEYEKFCVEWHYKDKL